jgi:hypothetical protein
LLTKEEEAALFAGGDEAVIAWVEQAMAEEVAKLLGVPLPSKPIPEIVDSRKAESR